MVPAMTAREKIATAAGKTMIGMPAPAGVRREADRATSAAAGRARHGSDPAGTLIATRAATAMARPGATAAGSDGRARTVVSTVEATGDRRNSGIDVVAAARIGPAARAGSAVSGPRGASGTTG